RPQYWQMPYRQPIYIQPYPMQVAPESCYDRMPVIRPPQCYDQMPIVQNPGFYDPMPVVRPPAYWQQQNVPWSWQRPPEPGYRPRPYATPQQYNYNQYNWNQYQY